MDPIIVIGAGLAGSEAAWQIAERGVPVRLYEMRPHKMTPAHRTGQFAELVCSNSFRANSMLNAVGILKEEMRRLNSLIMKSADRHQVPAGGALAVDRDRFAEEVTRTLIEHPLIEVIHEEIQQLPTGITVVATGPLTSDRLSAELKRLTGEEYFYFYDAAAPIVTKESIDMEKVFVASRYDKGEASYINCPMTEEEFERFYQALVTAEVTPLKEFEKAIYFEGCMPIEVMAKRGKKTILFGPLKPVGLVDPRTGERPYAVVQLRQDNQEGTLYNMVGFQTHLKWGAQKEVIQLIPGLEHAEIVRYGVMHRNTFINSPKLLKPTYQFRQNERLFFAGQMTGVEGYVESAASGLIAGINAARLATGQDPVTFPPTTVMGSLAHYITTASVKHFQPMNANFGLLPSLENPSRNKKDRAKQYAFRAIRNIQNFSQSMNICS